MSSFITTQGLPLSSNYLPPENAVKIVRYNPATRERPERDDGKPPPARIHLCPCCTYKTLAERGDYEICPVCFWEDDGQDDRDANDVRGGPNGSLSLTARRENFQSFGACEKDMLPNVRPPYDVEKGN